MNSKQKDTVKISKTLMAVWLHNIFNTCNQRVLKKIKLQVGK